MVTMSTAENALKSYYLDYVSDQLNYGINPFLAKIKQTTSDVWGKDVRKVVRYGLNGGIGAGTEDGTLPTPMSNNYAQFVATLKNLYGTIEITDKAIRASANNEGAFVSLLNDEMEGLVKSSAFHFSRMLFGDGTGKIATVIGIDGVNYKVDSTAGLAEGMLVDLYKGSNSIASSRTITSVDRVEKTIMLSGATVTTPEGAIITLQRSYGLELTGLAAIFSDSETLYGVNRSENKWMKGYVEKNTGDITEAKVQLAIDKLEEYSGSKVNFIICSWGVRRALAQALSKYKTMDSVELDGGFHALSFNGIPVVADRFCPHGTMYLLNTDDFSLHQLCDWQWLESEDGSILKQKTNKAAFAATLVKYAELICSRPCGQGMLSGIVEA